MLTGFLCSAALLMIIIAYSRDSGGGIAGGPRDYLYYQIRLKYSDPDLDPADARLQFYITTPENQKVVNRVNEEGNLVLSNAFFDLTQKQEEFYVWGPSYALGSGNGNEVIYNIYGVTTTANRENWRIDALYFDHRALENGINMEAREIKEILDARLEVKVYSKTLNIILNENWNTIRFGDVKTINLTNND